MKKFGFISLGLIGGSIARALKEKYPDCEITAYNRTEKVLQQAMADGVVDVAAKEIGNQFSDLDVIFLCAPVAINNEAMAKLKPYLSEKTILTDVGSVKNTVVDSAISRGLGKQFIGGHPMAGSERVGYANSAALLLENAYYILTPTKETPGELVTAMETLVRDIGALPLILTPEEHDYVTAGISHVPHVISASLVNLVKDSDNADGTMKLVAAGGFKDITRISSSSPEMWQHICMANTEPIVKLLDDYIEELTKIRGEIKERDEEKIIGFFSKAREYRESFINASSGPIKRSYVLYVEIPDEPGALATIVSLIAFQRISIKNIGITHNREIATGSLRLELYEENEVEHAATVLREKNYLVTIPEM